MRWITLFLIFVVLSVFAPAQTANVYGAGVTNGAGGLLSSGHWCFGASCVPVSFGSFSGTVSVATSVQTVTVVNASSAVILTVPNVSIFAADFNWNQYVVPTGAQLTGVGAPYLPCFVGASYNPGGYWCSSFSGQASWSATATPQAAGAYIGYGTPVFYCSSPCTYTQIDTGMTWGIMKPYGTPSNSWGVAGGAVNGIINAAQQQTGAGNNGIANSITTCGANSYPCEVIAPPSYALTEAEPWGDAFDTIENPFQQFGPKGSDPIGCVLDYRFGPPIESCNSGIQSSDNRVVAGPIISVSNPVDPQGIYSMSSIGLRVGEAAFSGGVDSSGHESGHAGVFIGQNDYTEGVSFGLFEQMYRFSPGDNLGAYLQTHGVGSSQAQNEGNELLDGIAGEIEPIYQGTLNSSPTCSSTGDCTLSMTQISGIQHSNNTSYVGGMGDNLPLIDLTTADTSGYIASIQSYTTGLAGASNLVTGSSGVDWATRAGGNTVSTTLTSAIWYTGTTINLPWANVVAHVASTTGFTVGHTVCLFGSGGSEWDCTKITAIGSGTITLAEIHNMFENGSTVASGGLTGQGIEFPVDQGKNGGQFVTYGGISPTAPVRVVYPIIASNGNTLSILTGDSGVAASQIITGAYYQMGSGGSASATVSGGAVTSCTVSGGSGYANDPNEAPALVISGISSTTAPLIIVSKIAGGALTACSVVNPGAGITGTPTVSVSVANPYVIYSQAKAWKVYNPATGGVDGTAVQTTPINGAAFASGDTIEQAHYFFGKTEGLTVKAYNYTPPGAHEMFDFYSTGKMGNNDYEGIMDNENYAETYMNYPANPTPYIPGYGQMGTPHGIAIWGPHSTGLELDMPPYGVTSGRYGAVVIDCFDRMKGVRVCPTWNASYPVLSVHNSNNSNSWDAQTYNPVTQTWTITAGAQGLAGSGATGLYTFGSAGFTASGNFNVDQVGDLDAAGTIANNFGSIGAFGNLLSYSRLDTAGLCPSCTSVYYNQWGPSCNYPTSVTQGATDPFGGTAAVNVVSAPSATSTCGGAAYSGVEQWYNFSAGQTYTFSVWVYNPNSTAMTISLGLFAGLPSQNNYTIAPGTWQRVISSGVAPTTAAYPAQIFTFNELSLPYSLYQAQLVTGSIALTRIFTEATPQPMSTGLVSAGTPIVPLALTTTGTSGASTYNASTGVLNIPQYSGGGSMTWPSGSAGIPNYNGSSAWGTSYNASNAIPASFVPTAPQLAGNNSFTATNSFGGNVTLPPLGTATSGTNYGSPWMYLQGSYWNGSAAATDNFSFTMSNATGTNPVTTLMLNAGGMASSAIFQSGVSVVVPALKINTVGAGVMRTDTFGNVGTSTALPNGTTATTQANGDTSNNIATDAFVANNSASLNYPVPVGTGGAIYAIDEGSGTTLVDSSGNGNNITGLSGINRIAGGLQFVGNSGDCVPTNILESNIASISMMVQIPVFTSLYSSPSAIMPIIIGSASTNSIIIGLYNGSQPLQQMYNGSTNNGIWSAYPFSGYHDITITGLGSTPTMYIDGVAVTTIQQNTTAVPSGSYYQLGCSTSTASFGTPASMKLNLYGIAFNTTTLTAQQAADVHDWWNRVEMPKIKQLNLVLPDNNQPLASASNMLACVGDSRCAGVPVLSGGPIQAVTPNNLHGVGWVKTVVSMAGGTGQTIMNQLPQLQQFYGQSNTTRVAVYFSGVNGFQRTADCPMLLQLKKLGYDVFEATEPSNTSETNRNNYNALIYSDYAQCGVVALVDLATVPSIGTNGASTSGSWATYFYSSGGPHFTTTGYGVISTAMQNAINMYYSNAPGQYTSYSAAGALTTRSSLVNITSGSLSMSLPDCQGMTGIPIRVKAFSTTVPTTNTVTLTTLNSELIDGASTLVFTANSEVILNEVPNAPATGGCYWQQQGTDARATVLGGDVSGTPASATVVKVNGASVPASATVTGTNSSSQIVAATTTGTGSVVLATTPNLAGVTTTSQLVNSTTAAASTPAELISAGLYTSGTGTTTQPTVLIQPSGATASTIWSTSGTALGVNEASGFAGDFINVQTAGVLKMKLNSSGNIYVGSVVNTTTSNDSAISPTTTGTTITTSVAGNVALLVNNSNATPTVDLLDIEANSSVNAAFTSQGIQKMLIGTAIASATTIAPITPVVHITGTTTITTITPPTGCTTSSPDLGCTITLIPDGLWATATGGNIAIASTAVVSKALRLQYDPSTTLWYPSY